MTNLEKFTSGEVAARSNGTLEQLCEVIEHCFPGQGKYYYRTSIGRWNCHDDSPLPTIDITQLWEELQALKKPEIWWIRVTEENYQILKLWGPRLNFKVGNICGMVKDEVGEPYKSWAVKDAKGDSFDFGNEIDFATFLKYTGVEPEKVEKSLEGKLNEISRLSDLRNDILERNKSLVKEFNEIETQISALLK